MTAFMSSDRAELKVNESEFIWSYRSRSWGIGGIKILDMNTFVQKLQESIRTSKLFCATIKWGCSLVHTEWIKTPLMTDDHLDLITHRMPGRVKCIPTHSVDGMALVQEAEQVAAQPEAWRHFVRIALYECEQMFGGQWLVGLCVDPKVRGWRPPSNGGWVSPLN